MSGNCRQVGDLAVIEERDELWRAIVADIPVAELPDEGQATELIRAITATSRSPVAADVIRVPDSGRWMRTVLELPAPRD
jgi:hypothetical protein